MPTPEGRMSLVAGTGEPRAGSSAAGSQIRRWRWLLYLGLVLAAVVLLMEAHTLESAHRSTTDGTPSVRP
jgi:hypothetical protein